MYNEAENVEATLPAALKAMESLGVEFEIVVVDDGSTDESVQRVERFIAESPRLKLICLERNERYGGAVIAGLNAGQYERLIYTDFDLPGDLRNLRQILGGLERADIVTCYAESGSKHESWLAMVMSKTFAAMVRTLFSLKQRDVNFGFKAIRKEAWQRLSVRSKNSFFCAELFVRARNLGLRVTEMAVPFAPRRKGQSRIRRLDVVAATVRDMIKLKLELRR